MIEKLKDLKCGDIKEYVDIKKYTTYKVGGKALALVKPSSIKELCTLLKYLSENKIKYKVIGNGSNLLFVGPYFDGVLIKLDYFNNLEIKNEKIIVGAGYNIIKLALKVANQNLTGLEFASGIPGTIGGCIFMNAGAYKSDMSSIVEKIKVITPEFKVKTLTNKELDFHYRSSFLMNHQNYICIEAVLNLNKGDKKTINSIMEERKKRRLETQPLNYPSAGSVFRNPDGDYAGRLIEEIGYKGKKVGGAMVSEKHANFIINTGRATGDNIKELITQIQKEVKKKYNIDLKCEQEIVE